MSKKQLQVSQCGTMCSLQKILNGKWKILILWHVSQQVMRFGELQRTLGEITQSTLTKQLRELEADGFLHRHVYPEVPPKVEYSLTLRGKSFIPILEEMKAWGESNLNEE